MRRVVTALALIAVAFALAACTSSATTDNTSTGTSAVTQVPAAAAPAPSAQSTSTDILSPTEQVAAGETFPKDAATVPTKILADLTAQKPMVVYFFDPTTNVAGDQRKEINAAIKKHAGAITLETFDYTTGVASGVSTPTADPEVAKGELMAAALKITTTPYIVFVDRNGRITYRLAGFADRGLLEREVLRATE